MKPSLICDFISLPLHTVTSAVLQSHSLYQNQIELRCNSCSSAGEFALWNLQSNLENLICRTGSDEKLLLFCLISFSFPVEMGLFIPRSAAEFSVHCAVQACEGRTHSTSAVFFTSGKKNFSKKAWLLLLLIFMPWKSCHYVVNYRVYPWVWDLEQK